MRKVGGLLAISLVIGACAGSDSPERGSTRLPAYEGRGRAAILADPKMDPYHSLLINAHEVIHDPKRTADPCQGTADGALPIWSFGYLMTQVAGKGGSVADKQRTIEFIGQWLELIRTQQTINGQPVAARPSIYDQVIQPWEQTGWDLTRAPFRLLAIVNRVDLRRSPLLAGENGGEVRFVFGAVNLKDCSSRPVSPDMSPPEALEFTVILEYGVRLGSCMDLWQWAEDWRHLSDLDFTDETFRQTLAGLTARVTSAGQVSGKPNASALDHIRSNEIALGTSWEMRQFSINPKTGLLRQEPVTLTPSDVWNSKPKLTEFLLSITSGIHADDYWVPLVFPPSSSEPFLAAVASPPVTWSPPNYNDDAARQIFALNTCSGCHSVETNTNFAHIDREGHLSDFLKSDLTGFRTGALNVLLKEKDEGCWAPLPKPTDEKIQQSVFTRQRFGPLVH
ncbi:MAG TPA: hypothetical protein VMS64_27505 [Candidatus Methylomirabilis sp.]|nr:hypothetical protein [Candidatus Methylomirabilis sp.]